MIFNAGLLLVKPLLFLLLFPVSYRAEVKGVQATFLTLQMLAPDGRGVLYENEGLLVPAALTVNRKTQRF